MDICGPNWTQNSSMYSGRVESAPPPSQYIPSLFSSSNEETKRMMHEKHPVLQKNGNYELALSNDKKMVLSVFRSNVYSHIWDNKNKKHVSLNVDELAHMLKNKMVLQDIMEQLLMPNEEKKNLTFHLRSRRMGDMHWIFLETRRWC